LLKFRSKKLFISSSVRTPPLLASAAAGDRIKASSGLSRFGHERPSVFSVAQNFAAQAVFVYHC
jgi:hypothetical protein